MTVINNNLQFISNLSYSNNKVETNNNPVLTQLIKPSINDKLSSNNLPESQIYSSFNFIDPKPNNHTSINEIKENLNKLLSKKLNNEDLKLIELYINELTSQWTTDKNILNETLNAIINKFSKDFQLSIVPKKVNGIVIGYEGIPKGSNKLSEQQKECIKLCNKLFLQLENLKATNGILTPQKIFLLGLRDSILQRNLELLMNNSNNSIPNDLKVKNIEFSTNLVQLIDNLVNRDIPIPNSLITDIFAVSMDKLGIPDTNYSSIELKNLKLIDSQENINNSLNPQSYKIETSSLNRIYEFLTKSTKVNVSEMSENINELVKIYSKASNSLQSILPDLPFPIKLPIPIVYNDKQGNQFIVPAGTTLQQTNSGYELNGVNLFINSNGNQILLEEGSIKLGKEIDKLSFNTFSVNTSNSKTELKGFSGEVDKVNSQLHIKASEGSVNFTDGKVELKNAELIQNPSLTRISSDKFYYTKNNNETSLTNFVFEQNQNNLTIQGKNLNSNIGQTKILASEISFNLSQDHTLNLSGKNIVYQNGDKNFTAQEAKFDIITNSDNTSQVTFKTNNASFSSNNQILNFNGDSVVTLNGDSNGIINNLTAQVDSVNFKDSNRELNLGGGLLKIDYDNNGNIQNLSSNVQEFEYKTTNEHLKTNNSNVQINYNSKGTLESLKIDSESVYYNNNQRELNIANGNLNINYDTNGNLKSIVTGAQNIDYTGQNETLHTQNSSLKLNFTNNNLTQINGNTDNLIYQNSNSNFNIVKGEVAIDLTKDGYISNIRGSVERLSYTDSKGTKLNASGIGVNITGNNEEITNASVQVGTLDYNKNDFIVNLQNGKLDYDKSILKASAEKLNTKGQWGNLESSNTQLEAKFNSQNELTNFTLNGDTALFNGVINDKSTNLKLDKFQATMFVNEDGSRKINFNGQNVNFNFDGNSVKLDDIKNIELKVNDNGNINGFAVNLNQNSSFTDKNNDLFVALKNANAIYNREGNNLSVNFEQLNITQRSKGLTGFLSNASIEHNDKQLKLHIASGQLIQKLEKDLNLKVEGVDLICNKSSNHLQDLDLKLKGLEAKVEQINIFARTENNERIRLNVKFNEDGNLIKETFLQIPNGGEIKIENNDFNLQLKGDQTISFKNENGIYTLKDTGLNINFATKNAQVKVLDGEAEVKLDTKTGDIIIEKLQGTKINAKIGDKVVNIDIDKLNGYIPQAGILGDNQGAVFRLKPSKDNSEITLLVETNVNGIPIKLKLDKVHEFESSAYFKTNQAHLYIGDVAKKGTVKLDVGPVSFKGSAIEFLVKYNTYDSNRMLSTMMKTLSTDGISWKGVTFSPNGLLKLETTNNGPHAGISIILPDNLLNRSNITHKAVGGLISLGWNIKNDYTKTTVDLYTGLVDGSYVSIDQLQGSTSVAGITLPKSIGIPTTAVGGLSIKRDTPRARFDGTIGGFVNPASLVNQDRFIKEDTKYGVYTGFNYRKDNVQVKVMGIGNFDRRDKVFLGVGATLEYRF